MWCTVEGLVKDNNVAVFSKVVSHEFVPVLGKSSEDEFLTFSMEVSVRNVSMDKGPAMIDRNDYNET